MALLGGYELIGGARGLTATRVTCNGVVMSPGDSCSTLRLKRSRYESWSPAGSPPTPPALPPDLQRARDRIMVRDFEAMRTLEHDDAGGQIAVGVWLLFPGLILFGVLGIAKLIIAVRRKR
ncbi:hypothetical protein [Mycolicibacterium sp. CBMA 226]|uniref:hypothetical protein n=1 Tax=Mycolicibacterium sp. CBMA 226 TaxID=2606611 RepID=UPI0012DCF6D4|nr:hypothetical protein [Mycolicibacterium sp. CBMA 226]MUL79713.1 hypothetical protein [Mycolicibacterium sp. CBMA 226]